MTRILHITEDFLPTNGGLARFCADLTRLQAASGHKIGVLTNLFADPGQNAADCPGIEVRRVPCRLAIADNNGARLKEAAVGVREFKQSFRPDIIHIHLSGFIPWMEALNAGSYPAASVVTIHTPPDGITLPPPVTRRLLQQSDRIVAVSEATRRDWQAWEPSIAGKSGAIWNGIPVHPEAPMPIPTSSPVLLCLGRLHVTKGFDVAMRAFGLLAPSSPARLVVAGDGPARPELEQLATELGIRDRVTFTGWQPAERTAELVDAATIVLMPSRWQEPFGLVAAEAAQRGRPVVASRVGGLPEIIVDGATGHLVPPEDSAALAAAITSLLSRPEVVVRQGTAARARALEHFTMDACAAKYAHLYEELLANRTH